ncbi:MAG TPA: acetyl-CoA carboxylase biotin carboxyl carrier protein subunit [Planctomycetota bacterium]|nr:acetyl-CoA carboxylase biotin carboxyl carrier protein subunit [Planctomycetota bacterium]
MDPAHRIEWRDRTRGSFISPGQREPFFVVTDGDDAWVHFRGRTHRVRSSGSGAGAGAESGVDASLPRAPMPGVVLQVNVGEGERVSRGDVLLSLEAMKIEHEIRAGVDGVVLRLHVKKGERVEAGAVLVEITAGPGGKP